MQIIEAINQVDALVPNNYTEADKISWLSMLDGMIKRDVIDTHEGGDEVVFDGYNEDTPTTTELIVKAPFDDMYVIWLESKIAYYNNEYVKCNNAITRYNDIYQGFFNDYNRNHMPLGKKIKYF